MFTVVYFFVSFFVVYTLKETKIVLDRFEINKSSRELFSLFYSPSHSQEVLQTPHVI